MIDCKEMYFLTSHSFQWVLAMAIQNYDFLLMKVALHLAQIVWAFDHSVYKIACRHSTNVSVDDIAYASDCYRISHPYSRRRNTGLSFLRLHSFYIR